jgi:hypothetical protein
VPPLIVVVIVIILGGGAGGERGEERSTFTIPITNVFNLTSLFEKSLVFIF